GVGPWHRRTGGDLFLLPARVQRTGYRRDRHRAAAPVPAHPRGPVRGGGRGPGRDRWPRKALRWPFPRRFAPRRPRWQPERLRAWELPRESARWLSRRLVRWIVRRLVRPGRAGLRLGSAPVR